MGLRDISVFGSSEEDSTLEVTDDLVDALNEDLGTIVEQLEQESFPVETRNSLQDTYVDLMQTGYELAELTDLKWVPPSEDPSSDEMAQSIDNLRAAIVEQAVEQRVSDGAVKGIRNAMVEMADTLEKAHEFNYAIKEIDVQKQHGRYVQSVGIRDDIDPDAVSGDPTEIYAGPRAREHLQQIPRRAAVKDVDVPLFLGTGVRNGKDATIPKKTLYRHTATLGVTGYGKSTLLTNNMKQLIEGGHGLCFIDPKGDDSEKLIEKIPDDRLDDVIWIEPGSSSGKVSGFNFINVGLDPDDPNIETAVSALVQDLVKMLGAGDYWGPRMDRITRNIIRAMNAYNRRNPDEPDLNLADFYYVLQSPESRVEFLTLIKAEGIDFIEDYTEKIAEMDEDNLEPILGRIQQWIESPIARRMICFRKSEINIPEAVEEGKIIIVRMGGQPDDLKKMLGMAVVRRIWATVRARTAEAEYARDPFYLIVDEAHHVALADDTFPKMLAAARSYRLSINLATQYLSQLPENVVRGIRVNCDTHMAFNPGSQDEARKISPQLDVEPQTLLNEGRFHIWTRTTDQATGELADPFKVYIHPPFPPMRTTDEANEIIQRSLDTYGREKLTPEGRKQRLQFYKGHGQMEIGVGEEIVLARDDPDIPPSHVDELIERAIAKRREERRGAAPEDGEEEDEEITPPEEREGGLKETERIILESVYAARVRAGEPPGAKVSADAVDAEVEARLGENYGSGVANTIEALSNYVQMSTSEGTETLQLTPDGRAEVFGSTGDNPTGGFYAHRRVLREAFEIFTRLGYQVTLPDQTGEEKSDGIGQTPFDPADIDPGNKSAQEIQEALADRMATLEERYPHVAELSGGREVRIEAETSTQFKPAQMLTNLRKSINGGAFTAFVTKDAYDSDDSRVPEDVEDTTAWWGRYIERGIYDREHDPSSGEKETLYGDENIILARERDQNGNRIFYNGKDHYTVGSEDYKALRPATSGGGRTTWRETDDGIVAEDTDNGVFTEFDNAQEVADGDPSGVPAYYFYDRSEEDYIVRTGEEERTYGSKDELLDQWETFREPFLPATEYEELPGEGDFAIIVVPNPDNPHHDQPLLYERGETTPLYDALGADVPDHALIREDAEHGLVDEGDDGQEVVDESLEEEGDSGADPDVDVDAAPEQGASSGEDHPEEGPSPGDTGPKYLFPEVRDRDGLPDACPKCGGELSIAETPFSGPATTLENFPVACSALADTDHLNLGSDPPMVTGLIEATLANCSECSMVATLYFPTEEAEESPGAESDERDRTAGAGGDGPMAAPDIDDGATAATSEQEALSSDGEESAPEQSEAVLGDAAGEGEDLEAAGGANSGEEEADSDDDDIVEEMFSDIDNFDHTAEE